MKYIFFNCAIILEIFSSDVFFCSTYLSFSRCGFRLDCAFVRNHCKRSFRGISAQSCKYGVIIRRYCVMQQPDGNSFCGDVVSDSFNKTSRDEDEILDQIYESKYIRIIIMMILILYTIIRKCILTLQ